MAIEYVIYARKGGHDQILKRIRREVQKDEHWTDKKLLEPNESQELKAVLSALEVLGLHVFRTESDYWNHKVIIGA